MKGKNRNRGLKDVQEYLSRELKGAERNAFERMLQKDDFADEAMEGLNELSAEQYKNDIKLLNSRINRRSGEYRRSLFYRVAASIAVLMIISSVFLIVERDRTSLKVQEGNVSYIEITKSHPVTISEPAQAPESMTGNKGKKAVPQKKEAVAESKESKEPEVPENTVEMADKEEQQVSQEPEMPTNTSKGIEQRRSAPPASSAVIHENAFSKIEPPVKEETVVVGYGVMRAKSAVKAGYSPAKPVDGIDSFKLYLRKSLYMYDTLYPAIETITAGFRVMKDGTIDSIRVIKSPDQAFTEKVKKLIKDGPVWQAAEKNGMPVDDDVTISVDLK